MSDIVTLDTAAGEGIASSVDIETVNDALEDLAKLDPPLARLVEMRFFGGMNEEEIAEALGVSTRTVVARVAEGEGPAADPYRGLAMRLA